jgi:hypothetical protein
MRVNKIYKVFVSSTYEDLRDERVEVQKALLKLNCLPVGMELFPAADDETWEFIKSQITDSDYYVILVAGRYGSIRPEDGRSFTELEFDYAQEITIPTIGFIHRDRGIIPRNKSELDPILVKKLDTFLEKVRLRPVRHFGTPHELALEVTTSFVDLKARKPAVGFVRANEAVDFKKYSELLEINRDLERRITELSTSCQVLSPWFDQEIECRAAYLGTEGHLSVSWKKVTEVIASTIIEREEEEKYIREACSARNVVRSRDKFI